MNKLRNCKIVRKYVVFDVLLWIYTLCPLYLNYIRWRIMNFSSFQCSVTTSLQVVKIYYTRFVSKESWCFIRIVSRAFIEIFTIMSSNFFLRRGKIKSSRQTFETFQRLGVIFGKVAKLLSLHTKGKIKVPFKCFKQLSIDDDVPFTR